MKVIDILNVKGRETKTVRPGESIETLSHRLRTERVGALIVCSDGLVVQGIISERDVVAGVALHGAAVLDKTVADLMTSNVFTCTTDDNLADVAQVMTRRRIRHLPVVDNGSLCGIVSAGDVMKARIDEMQLEANVLRDYAIAHN